MNDFLKYDDEPWSLDRDPHHDSQKEKEEKEREVAVNQNDNIDEPLRVNWRSIALKSVLWWATLRIFYEFGAHYIFVLASVVFAMFSNLEFEKKSDSPSAYSLFNENLEPLPGTTTSAQVDATLRHGVQMGQEGLRRRN